MAKFIVMGCYTAKGLGGFVNNPDTDRKAATTALCAAAGAKLTGYAGLRGKYDFMERLRELLNKLLRLEWWLCLVVQLQTFLFMK